MNSLKRSTRLWAVGLSVGAGLLLSIASVGAEPPTKAEIGKPAPAFSLHDAAAADTDKPIALADLRGKPVVLVFYNHTCSTCPGYDQRLAEFAAKYKDTPKGKGVAIFAIDSMTDRTAAETRDAWAKKNTGFAILRDPDSAVAKAFGVDTTPTAVVIDAKGVLRYWGAFDDKAEASQVKSHFVIDAVEALLSGREVPKAKSEPFG